MCHVLSEVSSGELAVLDEPAWVADCGLAMVAVAPDGCNGLAEVATSSAGWVGSATLGESATVEDSLDGWAEPGAADSCEYAAVTKIMASRKPKDKLLMT
jgi:hypothetical protein